MRNKTTKTQRPTKEDARRNKATETQFSAKEKGSGKYYREELADADEETILMKTQDQEQYGESPEYGYDFDEEE